MPLIQGSDAKVREYLHGQHGEHHMILTQNRKYLYYEEGGTEQVFYMTRERRDDTDLSGDGAESGPLRELLIAHLTQENNPAGAGGRLVNAGCGRTDRAILRGVNPLGWH